VLNSTCAMLTETQAEKADITPKRSSRSSDEKNSSLPMLAISIPPPEQARITMELELMVVHTANTFLMIQFSQGRMSVDSIKRTVDTWKGKGRPGVIEFHYDQATQRDLVVANQHNFRFYGERARDNIRIDSMLYNWKQVASIMSIRTFCNADTVIMKLIFDLEQILELLGAAESLMLRIQQIRGRVNDMIYAARQSVDIRAANGVTKPYTNGEEYTSEHHSSYGSQPRRPSCEDAYGGLKLVPDFYRED
jgi:hypothetical protein